MTTWSTSTAVLLVGFGSEIPGGKPTVTRLLIAPLALEATVACTVKRTLASTGKSTVVLMLPTPAGAAQIPPDVPTQVQDTLVSEGGKMSTTGAPTTRPGPRLETVMV